MMTLADGHAASVNTVFARVAWELGTKNVAATAKRMGITTKIPKLPVDRAGRRQRDAARDGIRLRHARDRRRHATSPSCITKVVDRDGKTIFEAKRHGKQRHQAAGRLGRHDVLKGVITRRHRHAAPTSADRPPARPAPARTTATSGSSATRRSSSRRCGSATRRSARSTSNGSRAFGGTVCAPIWASFMRKALGGRTGTGLPEPAPTRVQRRRSSTSRSAGRPSVKGLKLDAAGKKLDGYGFTVDVRVVEQAEGHGHRPERQERQDRAHRVQGQESGDQAAEAAAPSVEPTSGGGGSGEPTPTP